MWYSENNHYSKGERYCFVAARWQCCTFSHKWWNWLVHDGRRDGGVVCCWVLFHGLEGGVQTNLLKDIFREIFPQKLHYFPNLPLWVLFITKTRQVKYNARIPHVLEVYVYDHLPPMLLLSPGRRKMEDTCRGWKGPGVLPLVILLRQKY